ncbi:energy transducer TonB [Solimonas sp. SE-A11]|uniref:energy transducer TonB n=1 Tax=Solimonas sp. SE-A11 TaxID=3054954 RepID=UPI00259C98DD|nr:energy transducer TonB [Solimonas sp. SE-A11]MDM4770103.1 energy transducer TonB [Solimonas sp. SE-A11]
MRLLASLLLGLVIVFGLFWLMQWMIRPSERHAVEAVTVVEAVEMVEVQPEDTSPQDLEAAADEPPPPPAAPPSLARPDLPTMSFPASAPVDAGPIKIPAINTSSLGLGGSSLNGSGLFGGFAGRGGGSGSGGGGGGIGKGEGFKGKPLIPLSTARPQMPEWACKQGIRGWVEVVFTVMPNGRVSEVKLVDADPRGVFEVAAIESVGNWIYQSTGKARTVKQRVDMLPEDCIYNWQQ